MLGTILPDLSDRFHLTPTQNGTIAFAQALGLMIASLGGRSAARHRRATRSALSSASSSSPVRSSRCRAPGLWQHRVPAVPARGGRRHRGDGRQRARQRRQRSAPRHRAEPGEPLLRAGRIDDAVHLRKSLSPQLGAPLLHRRSAHDCHHWRSGGGQHARAHAGLAASCSPRRDPFSGTPLLFLLGLFLFLYVSCEVGVWNWLARHLIAQGIPGVARAQHPVARIRAWACCWAAWRFRRS